TLNRCMKPLYSVNKRLKEIGTTPINKVKLFTELLKRPEVSYSDLMLLQGEKHNAIASEIIFQIEFQIKYEGYIKRQHREIENFRKIERIKIPSNMDVKNIPGLSSEVVEKLSVARPFTLGEASRISGITPAAISLLMVYLKRIKIPDL
ncbi:unnamed protein product, partial [marine sediment metagenome]